MGRATPRDATAGLDRGRQRVPWIISAVVLVAGGLAILAWPKVDETFAQWNQHELAATGDLSSSRYAWALIDAYDELAATFEDALVSFEIGAVPVNAAGVAISREPLGASPIPVRRMAPPQATLPAPSPPLSAPGDEGSASAAGPPDATAWPPPAFPGSSIRIPTIGVNQAVVEGVARADLRLGPGHYPGTAMPGEVGNMVISGHRTTYTKPFHDLDLLEPGDPVVIDTPYGSFRYLVKSAYVVAPENVEPLLQTEEAVLTLTTCNPKGSARQRLVVRALFAGGAGA